MNLQINKSKLARMERHLNSLTPKEAAKAAEPFTEGTQQVASKSPKYLAAGFSIVGAVLAAVSIYTTIEEMKAFYKVNFVPIPKYIVDKADITAKNAKGQEVMIKNQTART